MELVSSCHFYLSDNLDLNESYPWFKQFETILLFTKFSRKEGRIYFEISEILKDVLLGQSAKSWIVSPEVTIWTVLVDFSDLFSSQQRSLCILLTFLEDLLSSLLFLLYEDSRRGSWWEEERSCQSVFCLPLFRESNPVPAKIKWQKVKQYSK